jgi:glycosyltransferase involved in cell wall biosynthesis
LDQTKRKYDLRRDYILSVGTLEQRKNHLQLLQAFVESDLHDTDLVLLGKKADAYPALIKFVMEHNLQERVKFIHDASFDHFPALYQASLGLVYVSKYEGFGIPILEAMQSGVPVMTGTLSSLPEVAGKAAIYAHPDDLNELKNGLNQLVYDQTKRIEILAQAQKQLPLFSTERMSKQLLMHYQQLIS